MRWHPPGPALLFCPADRPDRYSKAAKAADMVILDLEDGVSPAKRPAAREAIRRTELDPSRTIVRINSAETADHARDLDALEATPYTLVMLAKTESAAQVASLSPLQVVALCETPRAVLAASEIASWPSTVAMFWGAEDLIAALGGHASRGIDGRYRDVALHSRSQVLLAAGTSGIASIDAVHLDIADIEGLRNEAIDAAASGFSATACIHPTQVATVRAAYVPTSEELAWALRVIAASSRDRGVFTFEGRMVDAPVLRHAQHILERDGRGTELRG